MWQNDGLDNAAPGLVCSLWSFFLPSIEFFGDGLVGELLPLRGFFQFFSLLLLLDFRLGKRTGSDIPVVLEVLVFLILRFELFLQSLQFLQFSGIIFLLLQLVLVLPLKL